MRVIILTGLPGSGKSTVCKNWFPHYTRINQDTLGNRQACIDLMTKELDAGKNVIVDRVNHTPQQRKFWIDLALQHGADSVTALVLQAAPDECVARIHARKDHETITEDMPLDKKREIVYKFGKDWVLPGLDEGFNTIIIHRN